MPKPSAGQLPQYKSTWDCFRKTVQSEGVKGLFKGNFFIAVRYVRWLKCYLGKEFQGMFTPIVAAPPVFAISFLGYNIGKKLQQRHPDDQLSLKQIFNAGLIAAIATNLVSSPVERVKCLLQVQQISAGPVKYAGPIDCIRQIHREGGIKSIFRGTYATLFRGINYFQAIILPQKFLKLALSWKNTLFL